MITLRGILHFGSPKDREAVFSGMRRFSAATRYAYRCLLEGRGDGEILKELSSLRWEWEGNGLLLRIHLGNRQWIRTEIMRKVRRERYPWNLLPARLAWAGATEEWFPYTATPRPKEGKVYVFISLEEDLAAISITRDRGVIGVDLAAFPHHLAGAEASPGGHLIALEAIPPTGMAG
jgi:predicted transposase